MLGRLARTSIVAGLWAELESSAGMWCGEGGDAGMLDMDQQLIPAELPQIFVL